MTHVRLLLAPWTRPLLSVVATHGLTDLSHPGVFGRYACWLALPLPSPATTLLFCLASLLHLSDELGGCGGSIFVHALVYEVHRLLGTQAALNAFLVYFAFVHTPLHYLTEHANGNGLLVYACLAATAVLLCLARTWCTFVLTDAMQKLVIAHVVTVECARRARARSDPSCG